MKKLFTMLLAASALFLSSCDIKGLVDEINSLTSLGGTTWSGSYNPDQTKPNEVVTVTYTFTETTFTAKGVNQEGAVQEVNGTYTYFAPNLVMTLSGTSKTTTGTVKDNKLTLNLVVLTRK